MTASKKDLLINSPNNKGHPFRQPSTFIYRLRITRHNLQIVYTIIFLNRFAAISNTITPIVNSTIAFTHMSLAVAPRRITPRQISIM
jgi:hypothetical protein